MTSTRWHRVQDLVSAVLDAPVTARAEFIETVCAGNTTLRQQLENLVESYEHAGSLIKESIEPLRFDELGFRSVTEGERIGPYQITGTVGHGGMGTVYRATRIDDHFRQQVAIKVVTGGFNATPELLRRFRSERQILANLAHPNIARLLDGALTASGLPYLVMEYIEGTTIDMFVKQRNLNIRSRLNLVQQVCGAVQHAHQNLVVHRDIKPANVMVKEDGTPKLLDFGIAKLLGSDAQTESIATTRAEQLMTPEYASPEQIRGEMITTATDVYGLGVLTYELLTGRRPFPTANLSPLGIERLICETTPELPSLAAGANRKTAGNEAWEPVSRDLDNIVLKAMHKEPARRYASAAALSEDIRHYLKGFPVSARADSWGYHASKFISRHSFATAAAAFFVIVTTALSIGLAIQVSRAQREAETSNEVSSFLTSLFEQARPDQNQGRIRSAREILDLAASWAPKQLSGKPRVEARLLDILGSTFYRLGALDQAESLASQAYQIRSRLAGPEAEETAGSLRTLASIARDRGELNRATNAYEKVLQIYTRHKGRESEETAEIINDIGSLRWAVGDFRGAGDRDREAIAILTQLKGPTHLKTLQAESDLERVLADQGEYEEAESLARKVLSERLRILGPNHPDVAESFSNLAVVLERTGRLNEAVPLERHSLELARRLLGPRHPKIATSLSNMNRLERKLGHYADAQQFGEEAVDMATKLVGTHSLATAACQGQLGLALLAQHDLQRARELLTSSLATRIDLGRPGNPTLGDSYDRLGLLDLADNNLAGAHANIQRGLEIREHFYGRQNDTVAASLNNMGRVLTAEGNPDAAEKTFREAREIAKAKFRRPHEITAEASLGLGTVLLSQGRTSEAKEPLAESLAMFRTLLPADHPDIATAAAAMKKCLMQAAKS